MSLLGEDGRMRRRKKNDGEAKEIGGAVQLECSGGCWYSVQWRRGTTGEEGSTTMGLWCPTTVDTGDTPSGFGPLLQVLSEGEVHPKLQV